MSIVVCPECNQKSDLFYKGSCFDCLKESVNIRQQYGDYWLIHRKDCPEEVYQQLAGFTKKAVFHEARGYDSYEQAVKALQLAIIS